MSAPLITRFITRIPAMVFAPEAPSAALPPHRGRDSDLAILKADLSSHEIRSQVLDRKLCGPSDAQSPAYRLFVARPKKPAPPEGWPVLYLLDGNAAFDFLTPELLAGVPDLVVVGIGYDTDKQFARARRIRDYSPPTAAGAGLRADPHHPERLAGGAERFLARLTGPIRAEAEKGLQIDPSRRMLWGHSFGGLCALYSLCTQPDAFARYAIISPSIWWDTPLVERFLEAAELRAGTRVHMALGDREKRTGSAGPEPEGPAPATLAVMAQLARAPAGLVFSQEIYEGAVHIATLPASLPAALRIAAA